MVARGLASERRVKSDGSIRVLATSYLAARRDDSGIFTQANKRPLQFIQPHEGLHR